jgi:hypothetical protein
VNFFHKNLGQNKGKKELDNNKGQKELDAFLKSLYYQIRKLAIFSPLNSVLLKFTKASKKNKSSR